MTGEISVAILGCGWAGARHFEAYRETDATVRWAVDVDEERARRLAAGAAETRVAADYEVALADDAVDAVDVCLPHDLHADVGVDAAEAGKHVFVEKPLAHSLDAADRLIEAADEAGVTLMVAENVRFDPVLRRVRDVLDRGVVGRPALVRIAREANLGDDFAANREWFLDEERAAGGIMMSGGIHDVEKCRMLLDAEPVAVYAARARQRLDAMEGDDTSVATIHFDDGTLAVLVESFDAMSLETVDGEEHTLRVDCDDGSVAVDGDGRIHVFASESQLDWTDDPSAHRVEVPAEHDFRTEVEHFLRCVRTGETPLTSGRDQRRPLEVVLAAYESMESGRPVSVGE
jgi:predicted dehydrogenase